MSFVAAALLLATATLSARAAIQFDIFLGYDGILPEASWFPVVCEVKNDGPTFTATVELIIGSFNQNQTLRTVVELPTGTLKRFVMPVFSGSTRAYNTTYDLRLLDERGRVRSEQLGLRPRKQVGRGTPILGAISRTAAGTPVIRPVVATAGELQPATARLLAPIFPDNPLVLEGLSSLYLNSERAADLTINQVNAILAWLNAGGHLIVGVEQPSDVSSSPWLRTTFPFDVKELKAVRQHPELQEWLRGANWSTNVSYSTDRSQPGARSRGSNVTPADAQDPFSDQALDLAFEAAEMQVAGGTVRDGKVEVAAGDTPLIVTATRGRGRITGLLFSPEREPVRSWKNVDTFWAKLADVPGVLYVSKDVNLQGGWSSDGIFGAMIDSRQVHKLPVGWLLLLLIVYLVVIGPFDQYWLKRIGKPMLTWITFPCYVVLFSLIIYFIGYKLRAGESEWNDLHVVDVIQNGERGELRGRTYASVYSPANQRYALEAQEKYATLRSEFLGWSSGGQSADKATVLQHGDSFKAEVFVPVWTSELYVSDWWHSAPLPLTVTVQAQSDGWQVRVDNRTSIKLANLKLVVEDRILSLPDLAAKETRTSTVTRAQSLPLRNFVFNHGGGFQNAINSRRSALGATQRGQLDDLPNCSMAASFLSLISPQGNYGPYNSGFISPPGLDLSSIIEHGNAVLLAYADAYSPVKPMYQFTPRRSHQSTLWRVAVPVQ